MGKSQKILSVWRVVWPRETMIVDSENLDVSTDDTDITEDSQLSSQDSTDLDTTLDSTNSAGDAPSGDKLDEQSSDNIDNATEKAITSFERFIFPEWPEESNGEALRVLRIQLLNGGGFCADMKLIDLSTPANVRLDTRDVLNLLKEKKRLNSIKKLVLPNVKELTAGDMVKNVLKDFCGVLCGENGKIKELVLRSDEISNEFTAGDLGWVKDFLSSYDMDTVTVSILQLTS